MKKDYLLEQYNHFISQLRVEVEQTFWFYNFFFAVDSALLSFVFFERVKEYRLLITIIVGLALSIYWLFMLNWKNQWRKYWLSRIERIEAKELKIHQDFRMWPEDGIRPRHGLWRTLFLLPKVFIAAWIIMAFIYLVNLIGLG